MVDVLAVSGYLFLQLHFLREASPMEVHLALASRANSFFLLHESTALKINFILSGNLKYDIQISLYDRLAQPGTQQKCTIITVAQNNAHAHSTIFSNYTNLRNEYVLLPKIYIRPVLCHF